MFLSIPILDLLNSQLEIGFDPLSGNVTYNIKLEDTPCLQHSNLPENVMLILQTSPGCLRMCAKSATDSAHKSAYDASQGQSDQYHAHFAERITPSNPDVHSQGCFDLPSEYLNSTFSLGSGDYGSPGLAVDQVSLLDTIQEQNSQTYCATTSISPISETLSSIASRSIVDDTTRYESDDFSACSDFQHDTSLVHAHAADNSGHGETHCYTSHSTSDVVCVQDSNLASKNSEQVSASRASPPTISPDFHALAQNSPFPNSSILPGESQSIVIGDTAGCDLLVESMAETSRNSQKASTNSGFSTTPPNNQASESESRSWSWSDKGMGYPCLYPSCNRVLKSLYTQQLHMRTHVAKSRKFFSCTMGCSESFTRNHDRLRHEVSQHGKECEFSCERCDKFFTSRRMLDRHMCWSSRIGRVKWQLKDC